MCIRDSSPPLFLCLCLSLSVSPPSLSHAVLLQHVYLSASVGSCLSLTSEMKVVRKELIRHHIPENNSYQVSFFCLCVCVYVCVHNCTRKVEDALKRLNDVA